MLYEKSMKAKPGDKVKVTTKTEIIEGILIPTPGLTGEDCIIVKIFNGYNIGISNDEIKDVKIIEKYAPPEVKTKILRKVNPKLPTVTVMSTGGTISSKVDYRTGGVYADYTAKDFVEMCPELETIANIRAVKFASLMSEDIMAKDWIDMAKAIEKEAKKGVDGIIVTHGTDTLHFTAAALSFFLEDIKIPVIIIGSQRSIDRGSSDAFMNLICGVKAAAEFDGSGVMTCLHGSIDDDYCILIRGTKVRKMHTSRRDAFRPINDLPFAKVYQDKPIEIISQNYPSVDRKNAKDLTLKASFEDKVALITIYPNLEPDILDFYIEKGYKGIVLAATALGHVNTWTDRSMIPGIKKAYEKGIPVIIASQTLYGRVNPYVYSNLRKVSIEGKGIYVEDMMPEVAYIKLGWVLSQTNKYDEVKAMMLKNCRGELNSRISPEMFLN